VHRDIHLGEHIPDYPGYTSAFQERRAEAVTTPDRGASRSWISTDLRARTWVASTA
jgi:hypothetical protein